MFGRKGPRGCHALDIGQQHAAGGQRDNALLVAELKRRQGGRRQPGRDRTGDRDAEAGQAEHRHCDDRQYHHAERDWAARQPAFSAPQQRQRGKAQGECRQIRRVKLPGQDQQSIRDIVTAAARRRTGRQLRNGDGQAGAGLESRQDAVADQLDQHAEPEDPGDQAEQADAERPQRWRSGRIGMRHPRPCRQRCSAIISEIAEVGPIAR